MATITVRNLPDEVVDRIKAAARNHGHSMEQEVRDILEDRFTSRDAVFERIERRWERLPSATKDEIDHWIEEGRGS